MASKWRLGFGIVMLAAMPWLAACQSSQPKEYVFTIDTSSACRHESRICVEPRGPQPGLKSGGDAEISIRNVKGPVRIAWESTGTFSLRFDAIPPPNKGGPAKKIGDEPSNWTAATRASAGAPWRLVVKLAPGTGDETVAAKYWVRHDTDELDPIIIVDR